MVLRKGREKSLLRRHPWVFSGAIKRVEGSFQDGDVVDVVDAGGKFLARGYLNTRSQIVVRVLTWEEEEVNAGFWRKRLERAFEARKGLFLQGYNEALRLVNAESDGLPGLVVDRYGHYLVVQFLTLGIERWKETIADLLWELLEPEGIYERSDVEVREKEGLELKAGLLRGKEPPDRLEIRENGLRFWVDLKRGHKTGFYLDQRENRLRFREFAEGKEVLNAFSYTGGFGIYALAGGARRVVHVDSSKEVLEMAKANVELNGFPVRDEDFVEGDVFRVLRDWWGEGKAFDLVVLDPPKFAHSKEQIDDAIRGYKDINLMAMRLLRPGGVIFTFSCSGLVSPELFQKAVF
ncbi:MAG: class I SAM-dependent rRNA methyltransferase, partial [Anaerolineae bacterium]|nr:class I SAM-dependent rRNA methyltransferase [Anaerolineae bacterium]